MYKLIYNNCRLRLTGNLTISIMLRTLQGWRTQNSQTTEPSRSQSQKTTAMFFTLSDPRNHRNPELSFHRQRWSQLKVYRFLLTAIVHRNLNVISILCHNYWVLCAVVCHVYAPTGALQWNPAARTWPVFTIACSQCFLFVCRVWLFVLLWPHYVVCNISSLMRGQEFSMLEIQTHFGHFVWQNNWTKKGGKTRYSK